MPRFARPSFRFVKVLFQFLADCGGKLSVVDELGAGDHEGLKADAVASPLLDDGEEDATGFVVVDQGADGGFELLGAGAGLEGVKVASGCSGAGSAASS